MNHVPAISVILPVYNAQPYLQKAVDSILAQTFTDFELLIIDDGSTDGSLELLKSLHDERIQLFARAHEGLIPVLNFGLTRARAP